MPTVFAKRDSNSSVYGPEVSQKSKLAFVAAVNSFWPYTLPVTGMLLSPAIKGLEGCNSANASVTNWSIFESRFSLNFIPDCATLLALCALFGG